MIDSVSTLPVSMQTGGVFILAVKCSDDTHSAASNCNVSVWRTYPFHRVSQEAKKRGIETKQVSLLETIQKSEQNLRDMYITRGNASTCKP